MPSFACFCLFVLFVGWVLFVYLFVFVLFFWIVDASVRPTFFFLLPWNLWFYPIELCKLNFYWWIFDATNSSLQSSVGLLQVSFPMSREINVLCKCAFGCSRYIQSASIQLPNYSFSWVWVIRFSSCPPPYACESSIGLNVYILLVFKLCRLYIYRTTLINSTYSRLNGVEEWVSALTFLVTVS